MSSWEMSMYSKAIYCAGPMRGLPQYNFPAFARVTNALRTEGWKVYSPAEHDLSVGFDPTNGLEHFDLDAALRWDIETILHDVDALYMLDGWEMSQGATLEHTIAQALNYHIIYETPKRSDFVYAWNGAMPKGLFDE